MLSCVPTRRTCTSAPIRTACSHWLWTNCAWSQDLAVPRLSETSDPVLSQWMTTARPRNCSSKVHIPKEIASNSRPIICPSPRGLNWSSTLAGGSRWVHWHESRSNRTAPKCGGVLEASQNKCKGASGASVEGGKEGASRETPLWLTDQETTESKRLYTPG